MLAPISAPQTRQTSDSTGTNQTSDLVNAEAVSDPAEADQSTDLAAAPPQPERSRRADEKQAACQGE
jgi:hypothetical protein